MKYLKPALILVSIGGIAGPGLAAPPFAVDSPGVTEKQHHFILFDYNSSSGGGKETEVVPEFVYKYGFTKDLEFKFSTSAISLRKLHKTRETGLGDITLTGKWRFAYETKSKPSWAIGYKLKIPTADKATGLGSGSTDNSFWLTGGKYYHRFGLYGNVGYNFLGADKSLDNTFYGLVATYKTMEHLTLGAQIYGNTRKVVKTKDELAWGVGGTYNYAPDRTLYASIGRSMRGYSNLNAYVGLGFTFK